LDWQSLRTLIAATTLTFVLGACTRTPEPERSDVAAKRESSEDRRLCEQYAQAAERVIERYHSEPMDFLHDVDGPMSIPGGNLAPRFAPPWTVRWSCTRRELYLRTRLPHDLILWAFGDSAQVTLNDLIRGIREDGLDPRADKVWIVVDVVDAEDRATLDPRKPYVRYR
jgi:hypothetical protein